MTPLYKPKNAIIN